MFKIEKTEKGFKFRTGGTGLISSVIGGLLAAWILSLFGFDEVYTKGMEELFSIHTTASSYYLIFAALGAISGLTSRPFNRKQDN